MIFSCDPPRHAILIHFGKRSQPDAVRLVRAELDGARVEIAVNPLSAPPSLVAIHFVRHGFQLPFVRARGQLSPSLNIRAGRRQSRYFFHFSYETGDCQEWRVAPGLTVLTQPGRPGSHSQRSVEDRPVLRGFLVDSDVLHVDVDMSELVIEWGADYLKDVSAMLFVSR